MSASSLVGLPSNEPTTMITCTRRLEWDALHRIPKHESRCRAFHGHRYAAELTCAAERLDDLGRIIDFGVIKERVGAWIDAHWDHTAILMRGDPEAEALADANERLGKPVYWLDGHPTAEHIVEELARVSTELLKADGVRVIAVRLWETPNCSAEWVADGLPSLPSISLPSAALPSASLPSASLPSASLPPSNSDS